MKLPHPFIQLPLSFDAARLAEEVGAVPESEWRPHPNNLPGNSMLPLIAVNGDPANERFAGPMRPTRNLERCQYLQQVMGSFGATLGRSRLMRLAGQAEVTRHTDQGYYWAERVRIHVPITTQPSVRFQCGDADVNMAAGECWIFDTWRLHRVINANDQTRIHLVVDSIGGGVFWQHVAHGRPVPGPQPANWTPRSVPFDPNAPAEELPFESVNVPAVMTPWELETHLAFLFNEARAHPQTQFVRQVAVPFARDWRAVWALYGDAPEGRPAYRQLIHHFMQAIRPAASEVTLANEANLFGAMTTMIAKFAVSGAEQGAMADRG
ncbi:MAG: aspartyl/asparaginyl beta-hydroxylase domain-containing protein [Hyphomonadaceae bacterium]